MIKYFYHFLMKKELMMLIFEFLYKSSYNLIFIRIISKLVCKIICCKWLIYYKMIVYEISFINIETIVDEYF